MQRQHCVQITVLIRSEGNGVVTGFFRMPDDQDYCCKSLASVIFFFVNLRVGFGAGSDSDGEEVPPEPTNAETKPIASNPWAITAEQNARAAAAAIERVALQKRPRGAPKGIHMPQELYHLLSTICALPSGALPSGSLPSALYHLLSTICALPVLLSTICSLPSALYHLGLYHLRSTICLLGVSTMAACRR